MEIEEPELKRCQNKLSEDPKQNHWVCELPFNHENQHESSREGYWPSGKSLWTGRVKW